MADIEEILGDEDEDGDSVIEMLDEQGNPLRLVVLMSLNYEENTYLALASEDVMLSEEDEADVIFMRVDEDAATQEEGLVAVEDEDLLDTLFERFLVEMERLEDEAD